MKKVNNLNIILTKIKNIYNYFDDEFWFGKEINRADKKVIEIKSIDKSMNENRLMSIDFKDLKREKRNLEPLIEKNLDVNKESDKEYEKDGEDRSKSLIPAGYIKLFLENTNTNELFIKHNITLKYLQVENNMYIKSMLLVNDDRELDCFSLGENHSLTIKKENNSILKLFTQEINGKIDEVIIVNGRVVA
jgi:hypothetical protein